MQVRRENKRIGDDPSHGCQGLWLPIFDQLLLAGPISELVGEIPVQIGPVRILSTNTSRLQVTTITLPDISTKIVIGESPNRYFIYVLYVTCQLQTRQDSVRASTKRRLYLTTG